MHFEGRYPETLTVQKKVAGGATPKILLWNRIDS